MHHEGTVRLWCVRAAECAYSCGDEESHQRAIHTVHGPNSGGREGRGGEGAWDYASKFYNPRVGNLGSYE